MKKLLIIIIIIAIVSYVGIGKVAGAIGSLAGKTVNAAVGLNTAENRAKVKSTVNTATASAKRSYENTQVE